jgi:hypothetical protein
MLLMRTGRSGCCRRDPWPTKFLSPPMISCYVSQMMVVTVSNMPFSNEILRSFVPNSQALKAAP